MALNDPFAGSPMSVSNPGLLAAVTGGNSGDDPFAPVNSAPAEKQDILSRENPDPTPSRGALVRSWTSLIKQAKEHWKGVYKQMREDQDFVLGRQWSNSPDDDRYVVNITLRHINQRVASLYAKNPRAIARKRKRLLNTVWDGTEASLTAAMQAMSMAAQATAIPPPAAPGMPPAPPGMGAPPPTLGAPAPPPPPGMNGAPPPGMPPDMGGAPPGMGGAPMLQDPAIQAGLEQAQAVISDAAKVHDANVQLDRISQTLEILYEYNIKEQAHPFKAMMKNMVRRSLTTGVGYVKLDFQRLMEMAPDPEARFVDTNNQLATVEQISADIHDGDIDENAPENEQLRALTNALANQKMTVAREGLLFDYPSSTSIIPDPKLTCLRQFVGADWVAEEFMLSPDEIKKIYKIDVGSKYTAYQRAGYGMSPDTLALRFDAANQDTRGSSVSDVACVWHAYNKADGLVYVVCDGYTDFLREPAPPAVFTSRFYPWFAYCTNEVVNERHPFPPSDVMLLRHQQREINRMREGVREHRIAARPLTVAAAGSLDEEDKDKLRNRPANALVELNGLAVGGKVADLLQTHKGPGVDPNLYETQEIFGDAYKVVGVQEATLGGPSSNGSATEANIAQSATTTSLGSAVDDLNDLLTEIAQAAGEILLLNVTQETAVKIVGPGAVWPEMSAQEVAESIYLEVESNSMGLPNKAEQISNAERIIPLLLQIPGINPEFIGKELLRRMDDSLDLTDAFSAGLPSMIAMNAMKSAMPPGQMAPGVDGAAGGGGGQNVAKPPPMNSQVGRGGPAPGHPPGGGPAMPAPNAMQ